MTVRYGTLLCFLAVTHTPVHSRAEKFHSQIPSVEVETLYARHAANEYSGAQRRGLPRSHPDRRSLSIPEEQLRLRVRDVQQSCLASGMKACLQSLPRG